MQGAEDSTAAPHIEADTEPEAAEVDRSEALAKGIELAPLFSSLAQVARAVNDALNLDWSAGAWRGLWVRNPEVAERVRKKLGTASAEQPRTITIQGDVRGVVFSDIHAPFHDRNAIALAAKVTRWWKPDVAIWNGDNADFYGASRYDKNPARSFRIQDEVDIWHIECMAPLVAAVPAKAEKILLPGNHEYRLEIKLWQNPDLFGIRSLALPELFDLKRFGIRYASQRVRFGNELEVTHGDRVSKWAGMSAKAEQEKRRFAIKTITGHVHRAGKFVTRVGDGYTVGQENPCLCSLSPEYMTDPDWVQGITLFTIRNGVARIQVVQFEPDYTCEIGKEFFSL
jgi:Calcineurin-like phosphoesterase